MKTYYDDFKNQTTEKMAQAIENMTFAYEQTRVPKKHYKQLLAKPIEELIADNVSLDLIETYFKTLQSLQKGNPKWFVQALICLETKTNPSKINGAEYQALELTYANTIGMKLPILNPEITSQFDLLRDGQD